MLKELLLADHLPLPDKLAMLQHLRAERGDACTELDQTLIEAVTATRKALKEVQAKQQELRQLIERLSAPPWYPATVLEATPPTPSTRVLVQHGPNRRLVGVHQDLADQSFQAGDEVYLGPELNVIMAQARPTASDSGETACFERRLADGRLVVKHRDEEWVVRAAASLPLGQLEPGDLLRLAGDARMACEKLERSQGRQFILATVPDLNRACVGGQSDNLERLLSVLTAVLIDPAKAAHYGRAGRRSIMLAGPPGCGKTLMARVAAAEIQRLSGKQCRFGVVKPAEWENPYVGVTEANIRHCFRTLREEARHGFAVLFLDEVESIGRARGGLVSQHADRFLTVLLTELEGFADRENVAIIAATNRKDLLDPALLERLSSLEIQVRRPDLDGARAIFDIHLRPEFAYYKNGEPAEATRNRLIETAVSKLYSPNGAATLCTLKFRDNRTRTVHARELVSGRLIQQICESACDRAFERDRLTGEPGLRVVDMEEAVAETIERLATTITARNASAYLADLPTDVDIVSVDAVPRKVSRPHRYLELTDLDNDTPVQP